MTSGMAARLLAALLGAAVGADTMADAAEFAVRRVDENFYLLSTELGNGYPSHVGVSVGDDGLLVVDGLTRDKAEAAVAEIRRLSDRPFRYVINTHIHADHTGINQRLRSAGATVVRAQDDWPRFGDPAEGSEDIAFDGRMTLNFNGDTVSLERIASHSFGDALVHFRRSNVLFLGDLYMSEWLPQEKDADVPRLIELYDTALRMSDDATLIVPGHGRLSTRAELAAYRDRLLELQRQVLALRADGLTVAAIAAHPNVLAQVDSISSRYASAGAELEAALQPILTSLISGMVLHEELGRHREREPGWLSPLVGEFAFSGGERVSFHAVEGGLFLQSGEVMVELVPLSSAEFYVAASGTSFVFHVEEGGKAMRLTRSRSAGHAEATRVTSQ